MAERQDLGSMAFGLLGGPYALEKLDIGEDASLSKSGMHFETDSYRVDGFGHLCIMRMNAMLGLMKMETVVLAPTEKDMPLLNLDWVSVLGRETQIAELYDDQLEAYPQAKLAAFYELRDRFGNLPNRETSPHWYDSVLYSCSLNKTGRKISDRLNAAARAYLSEYVAQSVDAPACNVDAKREKVREFAETLFSHGGPAVDQVTKLFGADVAHRLIVEHMYGISE